MTHNFAHTCIAFLRKHAADDPTGGSSALPPMRDPELANRSVSKMISNKDLFKGPKYDLYRKYQPSILKSTPYKEAVIFRREADAVNAGKQPVFDPNFAVDSWPFWNTYMGKGSPRFTPDRQAGSKEVFTQADLDKIRSMYPKTAISFTNDRTRMYSNAYPGVGINDDPSAPEDMDAYMSIPPVGSPNRGDVLHEFFHRARNDKTKQMAYDMLSRPAYEKSVDEMGKRLSAALGSEEQGRALALAIAGIRPGNRIRAENEFLDVMHETAGQPARNWIEERRNKYLPRYDNTPDDFQKIQDSVDRIYGVNPDDDKTMAEAYKRFQEQYFSNPFSAPVKDTPRESVSDQEAEMFRLAQSDPEGVIRRYSK